VTARFKELLEAGLEEIMVSLVPTVGENGNDDDDQAQLAHLIGRF
jgi:hypothetical protein